MSFAVREEDSLEKRVSKALLQQEQFQIQDYKPDVTEAGPNQFSGVIGISAPSPTGNYFKKSGDVLIGRMANSRAITEIQDGMINLSQLTGITDPFVVVNAQDGMPDELVSIVPGVDIPENTEVWICTASQNITFVRGNATNNGNIVPPGGVDLTVPPDTILKLMWTAKHPGWVILTSSAGIGGGNATGTLEDLADTNIESVQDTHILIWSDAENKWVNTSLTTAISMQPSQYGDSDVLTYINSFTSNSWQAINNFPGAVADIGNDIWQNPAGVLAQIDDWLQNTNLQPIRFLRELIDSQAIQDAITTATNLFVGAGDFFVDGIRHVGDLWQRSGGDVLEFVQRFVFGEKDDPDTSTIDDTEIPRTIIEWITDNLGGFLTGLFGPVGSALRVFTDALGAGFDAIAESTGEFVAHVGGIWDRSSDVVNFFQRIIFGEIDRDPTATVRLEAQTPQEWFSNNAIPFINGIFSQSGAFFTNLFSDTNNFVGRLLIDFLNIPEARHDLVETNDAPDIFKIVQYGLFGVNAAGDGLNGPLEWLTDNALNIIQALFGAGAGQAIRSSLEFIGNAFASAGQATLDALAVFADLIDGVPQQVGEFVRDVSAVWNRSDNVVEFAQRMLFGEKDDPATTAVDPTEIPRTPFEWITDNTADFVRWLSAQSSAVWNTFTGFTDSVGSSIKEAWDDFWEDLNLGDAADVPGALADVINEVAVYIRNLITGGGGGDVSFPLIYSEAAIGVPTDGDATVDLSSIHAHVATMRIVENTAVRFSNLPPEGRRIFFQLEITQDESGGHTVTFPEDNIASLPNIAETANTTNIITGFADHERVFLANFASRQTIVTQGDDVNIDASNWYLFQAGSNVNMDGNTLSSTGTIVFSPMNGRIAEIYPESGGLVLEAGDERSVFLRSSDNENLAVFSEDEASMRGRRIADVAAPVSNGDVATKAYVDTNLTFGLDDLTGVVLNFPVEPGNNFLKLNDAQTTYVQAGIEFGDIAEADFEFPIPALSPFIRASSNGSEYIQGGINMNDLADVNASLPNPDANRFLKLNSSQTEFNLRPLELSDLPDISYNDIDVPDRSIAPSKFREIAARRILASNSGGDISITIPVDDFLATHNFVTRLMTDLGGATYNGRMLFGREPTAADSRPYAVSRFTENILFDALDDYRAGMEGFQEQIDPIRIQAELNRVNIANLISGGGGGEVPQDPTIIAALAGFQPALGSLQSQINDNADRISTVNGTLQDMINANRALINTLRTDLDNIDTGDGGGGGGGTPAALADYDLTVGTVEERFDAFSGQIGSLNLQVVRNSNRFAFYDEERGNVQAQFDSNRGLSEANTAAIAALTDALEFNPAEVAVDIVPDGSNTRNLGSIDNNWNVVYANHISTNTLSGTIGGTVNQGLTFFDDALTFLETAGNPYPDPPILGLPTGTVRIRIVGGGTRLIRTWDDV